MATEKRKRLLELLGFDPDIKNPNPTQQLVIHLGDELIRREKELKDALETAARDLTSACDTLVQEGRVLNSLGILQSKGSKIDRLAGEVAVLQDAITFGRYCLNRKDK